MAPTALEHPLLICPPSLKMSPRLVGAMVGFPRWLCGFLWPLPLTHYLYNCTYMLTTINIFHRAPASQLLCVFTPFCSRVVFLTRFLNQCCYVKHHVYFISFSFFFLKQISFHLWATGGGLEQRNRGRGLGTFPFIVNEIQRSWLTIERVWYYHIINKINQ